MRWWSLTESWQARSPTAVIPAKAGIQLSYCAQKLDPGFRRGDVVGAGRLEKIAARVMHFPAITVLSTGLTRGPLTAGARRRVAHGSGPWAARCMGGRELQYSPYFSTASGFSMAASLISWMNSAR